MTNLTSTQNSHCLFKFLAIDFEYRTASWQSDSGIYSKFIETVNSIEDFKRIKEVVEMMKETIKNYTVFYKNGDTVVIKTFSTKNHQDIWAKLKNDGIEGATLLEGLPAGQTNAEIVIHSFYNWDVGDIAVIKNSHKVYVMEVFDVRYNGKMFHLTGCEGNPLKAFSIPPMDKKGLNHYLNTSQFKFGGKFTIQSE